MPESRCPFCALDDPEMTVYADAMVQAIVSRAPINRYHILIVPRVHVERLPDLPPHVATAVIHVAQSVGRAIASAGAPDGITYVTEDDLTGQGYNRAPLEASRDRPLPERWCAARVEPRR